MILDLYGIVKDYSWGVDPEKSPIKDFILNNSTQELPSKLAELWFGVHPSGTAIVNFNSELIELGIFLKKIKKENLLPEFLAKILSVGGPLSIQIHPDTKSAPSLHIKDKVNYPDTNSKPEMAIAITDLKLFYGIRPFDQIINLFRSHSGFLSIKDKLEIPKYEKDLKNLIISIYKLSSEELQIFSSNIKLDSSSNETSDCDLIITNILRNNNILDHGIVFSYLMNIILVPKGEAIFIKPRIPHAYISGDLFECMLNSDNVIRGGLTGKYIDVDNFIKYVDLNHNDSDFKPFLEEKNVKNFILPECNFKISKIIQNSSLEIKSEFSILLVLKGEVRLKSEQNEYSLKSPSSKLIILELDKSINLSTQDECVAFLVQK